MVKKLTEGSQKSLMKPPSDTPRPSTPPPATEPPKLMTLEQAREINEKLVNFYIHHILDGEIPLPDIKDISLQDMITATEIIKAQNVKLVGPGYVLEAFLDDRAIAAIYTLQHYRAAIADDPEPIIVADGKGLFLLRIQEG
jgi:hypothetical protein